MAHTKPTSARRDDRAAGPRVHGGLAFSATSSPERMMIGSGQAAAIRLSGSVCYHSLCNALGIDVPWSAVGQRLGRPTATAEPRR
jgi:hypothetical protein